jgi:hypothetical protein
MFDQVLSVPWKSRSREVVTLFNPAFCCIVLSSAVVGYSLKETRGMFLPLSYLLLPLVLHKPTRDVLPNSTSTSLAAWLEENPSVRIQFQERVKSLKPFVGEAIIFGARHNYLSFQHGYIISSLTYNNINSILSKTHGEVRECIMRARLVGKWMAAAGSVETVFGLWEIRP